MNTKADLIAGAYSQLRISGLTVNPTGSDLQLALERLENMVEEFDVAIGYNFENVPNASSLHNVKRKYWQALQTNLAVRLIPDFNKEVPEQLQLQANQSLSNLVTDTIVTRQVNYPSRQPVGSGNRSYQGAYNRYYSPTRQAPNSPQTVKTIVGNIDNYSESFEAYLDEAEDLASYVLTAEEGLTVLSESLATPSVNFQLSFAKADPALKVVIVATTTAGRVTTRVVYFEVVDV